MSTHDIALRSRILDVVHVCVPMIAVLSWSRQRQANRGSLKSARDTAAGCASAGLGFGEQMPREAQRGAEMLTFPGAFPSKGAILLLGVDSALKI